MAKVNDVKTVKGAAETDLKKEVKASVETKAPAKVEVKTEETKAPVKEEPKTEETKAPAKKAPAKKTTAKKTTTKKEAAAKSTTTTSRKEKEAVYVQFGGKEILISEVLEKAKAAYEGSSRSIKEFNVYVKPEDNLAYVVVNGEEVARVEL